MNTSINNSQTMLKEISGKKYSVDYLNKISQLKPHLLVVLKVLLPALSAKKKRIKVEMKIFVMMLQTIKFKNLFCHVTDNSKNNTGSDEKNFLMRSGNMLRTCCRFLS
ncbi:CLUMA_CG007428, isoform A [Clunio marinus]|uniref:CLUMA_CG007428, isoform A n=1 Tax=Clunio marinus TaxID=568069 RepID=A0A1J1I0V4_9DIPT|nr:CLUMA_CG007428, isoform A [Clunio marinus]